MNAGFDQWLSRYEKGHITRRDVLSAFAAIAAAAPVTVEAQPTIGTIKQLNHVTVFVQDVQKSVEFYQSMFGMPVLTPQDPGVNLNAGSGFLGIYPAQGGVTGINHVCFGLDGFDADDVLKRLTAKGLNANIRLRGDTKELYFTDSDNIRVQLQDTRYRGGVGPLGNRDPK